MEYEAFDTRHRAFRALTADTRQKLLAIYSGDAETSLPAGQQEAHKTAAYAAFRQSYAQLKQQWGGYTGYDAWAANANNAAFGALAAYDVWVSAFEALFREQHGDWAAFYIAAKHLAGLPRGNRTARLQQLKGKDNGR